VIPLGRQPLRKCIDHVVQRFDEQRCRSKLWICGFCGHGHAPQLLTNL
jgi:hypothetical protein